MPGWTDTLTLPDGSAAPVNQTYDRISVSPEQSVWLNSTAKALGNTEILKIRRTTPSPVKEGAVLVPVDQINIYWSSKDSSDASPTVFNLTMKVPIAVQSVLATVRKKVKGFCTGVIGTMLDTDAERDVFSQGRVY